MKITSTIAFLSAILIVILCCLSTAQADTFGSGANQFDIDFVAIGNPGNNEDTTGSPGPPHLTGKVDYTYRMGQFEISRDMITKANNEGGLGITMDPMGFVTGGARDDMPATGVSWFEAAQFVNWLNGSTPAYKFDGGGNFQLWDSGEVAEYNSANPYRSNLATYFLPSVDEWYKAAYYNAGTGSYGDYPTANGLVPTAVASGTAANTAVYDQSFNTGPADITQAGGLSPYGTMGQAGNAWEWEETDFDLVNDSSSSARDVRGGEWLSSSGVLSSSVRISGVPAIESFRIGFRVASIPEPSSLLLGALATVGLSMRRRW